MIRINEIDETLMSICAETQGRFELDAESGEPNANCVFAMLILEWHDSSSLVGADEKDAPSMDSPYRLVYPNTPADQVINKMQTGCLKLVTIIQKCKYKISTSAANNVINMDAGNAYNSAFIHAEIGGSERKDNEDIPTSENQTAGCGKGRRAKRKQNL